MAITHTPIVIGATLIVIGVTPIVLGARATGVTVDGVIMVIGVRATVVMAEEVIIPGRATAVAAGIADNTFLIECTIMR